MPERMQVVEANGARVPLIGLGTWDLRGRVCARMVEDAIELGYRHIDTASMYRNEESVGAALRHQARRRIHHHEGLAERSCAARLRALDQGQPRQLKLPYVDLLLIHWPNPSIPLAGTIGALCKMKRDGLARHIGVSNFTVALIAEATKLSTEPLVTLATA